MKTNSMLLTAFTLASIIGCSNIPTVSVPEIPHNPPVKEVRWLEQNWSADERFWFHHVSQGTSTLPVPYSWFLALEQPELSPLSTPGLLSDPDYLRRYGFIPSPKQVGNGAASQDKHLAFYGNPDGLPVGFSKLPASPDPVTGEMQPDQIGFTCAACHTGQIEYRGTSLRIDGAPAMTDLGNFRNAVGLALAQTDAVPGRFGRFAERVLGETHTAEQVAQLQGTLKALLTRIQQLKTITDTVAHQNVEEGFARLDAINRIGTQETKGSDPFTLELRHSHPHPCCYRLERARGSDVDAREAPPSCESATHQQIAPSQETVDPPRHNSPPDVPPPSRPAQIADRPGPGSKTAVT